MFPTKTIFFMLDQTERFGHWWVYFSFTSLLNEDKNAVSTEKSQYGHSTVHCTHEIMSSILETLLRPREFLSFYIKLFFFLYTQVCFSLCSKFVPIHKSNCFHHSRNVKNFFLGHSGQKISEEFNVLSIKYLLAKEKQFYSIDAAVYKNKIIKYFNSETFPPISKKSGFC